MVKIAVYCPRFPEETDTAWHSRLQECRLYIRKVKHVDALEFETLDDLQIHYSRHAFRRIIVARSGYYDLDFWFWARNEHISILDVLLRSDMEQTESDHDLLCSRRDSRSHPVLHR